MRDAFFRAIEGAARADDRVIFLTADLGYKLFDPFAAANPGRCLNLGVAEANMIGVAAGLALEGFRPFAYSIAPFATARCLEQIRNSLCGMGLPVVVCGVGAGYAYGVNGATHHGVDDLGLMRALPGMTVLSPCDPRETAALVLATLALDGPAYLRLGRGRDPVLPGTDGPVTIGRPTVLREGREIALVATGGVASEALAGAEMLTRDGADPLVLSAHTVKPLGSLVEVLADREVHTVLTVEEHGPYGGLHEALCADAMTKRWRARILRASAPDRFVHDPASQGALRRRSGIDAASLAAALGEARC